MYPLYWQNHTCAPIADNGKYLLMSKRNGGWNNERMIIENALILAWVTQRTLVIPKELHYDHMHGKESFETFLDLRCDCACVRVCECACVCVCVCVT